MFIKIEKFICLLILALTQNIHAMDVKIIADTNAVLYNKPDGKLLHYTFREGELLPTFLKTNINNIDWLFVKLPNNVEGYIKTKYIDNSLNNQDSESFYKETLSKIIYMKDDLKNYYTNTGVQAYYYSKLKFFDCSKNGYTAIRYYREDNNAEYGRTLLFLIETNKLRKIAEVAGIMDKIVFTNRYILIIDHNNLNEVSILDKQIYKKDDSFINPGGKLYKISDTFSMIYLYANKYGRDEANYFDFDEKTYEITAHVKDKENGQIIVEKWRFDNGKYVKE
jgi:hypothetical protein